MKEHCPILKGSYKEDEHHLIHEEDLPAKCVSCMYVALHGRNAQLMMSTHAKTTASVRSSIALKKPSEIDGTSREGVIWRRFGKEDDAVVRMFECTADNKQSAAEPGV